MFALARATQRGIAMLGDDPNASLRGIFTASTRSRLVCSITARRAMLAANSSYWTGRF
jgi:hypothetical protein